MLSRVAKSGEFRYSVPCSGQLKIPQMGPVGSGGHRLSLAHTTKVKVHGPTTNFAGRRFATESESREWLLEDL